MCKFQNISHADIDLVCQPAGYSNLTIETQYFYISRSNNIVQWGVRFFHEKAN